MSRVCQFMLGLFLAATVFAEAQKTPRTPVHSTAAATTNRVPPAPQLQSPVSFFRKLLAMSPAELNDALTNRSPEARDRILAKVQEYQLLPPDARELRLRATELRWWLTPMLGMSPADQDKRLAQAPEDLRPMIQSRLEQWRILPPPLQQEYLESDQAVNYLTILPTPPPPEVVARQKKIAESFNRFFELTPDEKEQTLNTLSDADRAQMEETLKTFEHLPPRQRQLCVQNYAKFAGMSAGERAEFLKNAERWSKMSPEERQSWRELVQQVPIWPVGWSPNQTPPLPPNFPSPTVATNAN
ncbi:MAG TPA: DUF3106 domain-containing protein [Candidatus Binatia bacterium]|nr:DUF3106 domain-containing protein [Candidatus Binatia bacterium]